MYNAGAGNVGCGYRPEWLTGGGEYRRKCLHKRFGRPKLDSREELGHTRTS